jgi:hypothetical protein
LTPLTVISRALVVGGLAGARPALTLCCLQLSVALLTDGSSVPEGFRWLVHHYAIVAVGLLAVLEHFARTDPDLDEVLEIPSLVVGVVTAALLPVLLPALDGGVSAGPAAPAAPTAPDAGPSVVRAGLPEDLLGLQGGAILAAVMSSLALLWTRRRVMRAIGSLSLSQRWYRWLETGGVVGAMAVLALLPAVAAALALVVVLGSAAAGAAIWAAGATRDDLARRPCPGCGHKVRVEAVACPKCGVELTPPRPLEG